MEYCTVLPIKDQRLCMLEVFVAFTQQYIQSSLYSCQRCRKCIQGGQYRVMLLMLKLSKVAQYTL